MAKFVYLYTGGQMAATPAEQEKAMQEWGTWFGTLGDSVAEMGNPFGRLGHRQPERRGRWRHVPRGRLLDRDRRLAR